MSDKSFSINQDSIIPKYMQIMEVIIEDIKTGKIEPGVLLPSLHTYTVHLGISKGTVEKAYRKLKEMGIIGSRPGKGFYALKYSNKEGF